VTVEQIRGDGQVEHEQADEQRERVALSEAADVQGAVGSGGKRLVRSAEALLDPSDLVAGLVEDAPERCPRLRVVDAGRSGSLHGRNLRRSVRGGRRAPRR
jgi:hypothetical protein